jgi:hypothetical protein
MRGQKQQINEKRHRQTAWAERCEEIQGAVFFAKIGTQHALLHTLIHNVWSVEERDGLFINFYDE